MSFLLKITKYHFKGLSSGSPRYILEGFLCYSPTIPFGFRAGGEEHLYVFPKIISVLDWRTQVVTVETIAN